MLLSSKSLSSSCRLLPEPRLSMSGFCGSFLFSSLSVFLLTLSQLLFYGESVSGVGGARAGSGSEPARVQNQVFLFAKEKLCASASSVTELSPCRSSRCLCFLRASWRSSYRLPCAKDWWLCIQRFWFSLSLKIVFRSHFWIDQLSAFYQGTAYKSRPPRLSADLFERAAKEVRAQVRMVVEKSFDERARESTGGDWVVFLSFWVLNFFLFSFSGGCLERHVVGSHQHGQVCREGNHADWSKTTAG